MAEDLEEDFDMDGGSDESGDGSGKKSSIKKILIIVLPILLLLGTGAGLYFSGILDGLLGKKHDAPAAAAHDEHGAAPADAHGDHGAPPAAAGPKVAGPVVFMDLPEMLVNLQSSTRKQAYLKLRVALELEGATDTPRVEQMMPRIVDSFQVYLRELRVEDLQGAAGMHLLREELLTRVTAAVKPVKVNDVLFREMLIQ